MITYPCCQHCEHEDGHRHLDPCEAPGCDGARPFSDGEEATA